MKISLIALLFSVVAYFQYACARKLPLNPPITHKVYFDIEANGIYAGRVVIGLFGTVAPKTVYNFYTLATNDNPDYGYLKTTINAIYPGFFLKGGDFETNEGTGGISIYGENFEPENFVLKHDRPYRVVMVNSEQGLVGSQFFITMTASSNLDGEYVVFGEVLEGFDTLQEIEQLGSEDGQPAAKVQIVDSGDLDQYYKYYTEAIVGIGGAVSKLFKVLKLLAHSELN